MDIEVLLRETAAYFKALAEQVESQEEDEEDLEDANS
jgi:hypothetical protein